MDVSSQLILQDVSIRLQNNWISEILQKGYVESKKPSKEVFLVKSISVNVKKGSLLAILGGSGSGKTTLLNVIAGRYDKQSYKVDGTIHFGTSACAIGYVTQNDFLLPNLTVRETLLFTAKLKVSKETLQNKSLDQLVTDVLVDLGLKECMNSRIGDNNMSGSRRGISGGEKRRVSVALQIITDPEILCADEPTSGLDSFTAVTVMESLKRLTTQRSTTVICSVHQPRADIFNIFDDALILSKGGHTIFCGKTAEMVEYFSRLGYDCPIDANPADFFIDLVSIDTSNLEMKHSCLARVDLLIQAYNSVKKTVHSAGSFSAPLASLRVQPPKGISWFQQVVLLIGRFSLNEYRDTSNLYGGIMQALLLAVICMSIFWQLGDDAQGISSRTGLFYIDVSMENYMLMVILIERYCRELKVYDRELQDMLYHPSAYYVGHIIANLPLFFIISVCFSVPVYFGAGLRSGWEYFLVYFLVNFAMVMIVNGLVWMSVSVDRRFSVASLVANVSFTFISLSAGFLVNYSSIPLYVRWVKDISFLSYAYRILMDNEFNNRSFTTCTTVANNEVCYPVTGESILSQYSVATDAYKTAWPVMIIIGIVYYTVGGVLLYYIRFPPTGSVASDLLSGQEADDDDEDEMLLDDDGEGRISIQASVLHTSGSNRLSNSSNNTNNNNDTGANSPKLSTPLIVSSSKPAGTSSHTRDMILEASGTTGPRLESGLALEGELKDEEGEGDDDDLFEEDKEEDGEERKVEENGSPSGRGVDSELAGGISETSRAAPSFTSTQIRTAGGVVINVYRVDLFVHRPADHQQKEKNDGMNANSTAIDGAADQDRDATMDVEGGYVDMSQYESRDASEDLRPSVLSTTPFAPSLVSSNNHTNHNIINDKARGTNTSSKPRSSGRTSSFRTTTSSKRSYKQILQNVSVEIRPGRLVAIMGGSGSGKTTLLNLIANRIPQQSLIPYPQQQYAGHSNRPSAHQPPTQPLPQQPKQQTMGEDNSVDPHFRPTLQQQQQQQSPHQPAPPTQEGMYTGRGGVYFNGRPPSHTDVRRLIGYVQQFDFHLPSLTVYETLYFQAKMRLKSPLESRKKRGCCSRVASGFCTSQDQYELMEKFYRRRVLRVLQLLGLRAVSNIRVGNEELKGISGGEKRRLSIGIQLLSNPAICLLDEPTTGLDAFTARKIVLTLRDIVHGVLASNLQYGAGPGAGGHTMSMAQDLNLMPTSVDMPTNQHHGLPTLSTSTWSTPMTYEQGASASLAAAKKTVILSIHQPRYDIFAALDDVILLSRGQVVWSGDAASMLRHFERCGHRCPPLVNPADFILDLSSIDFRSEEKETESKARLSHLVEAYRKVHGAQQARLPFIPLVNAHLGWRQMSTNTMGTRISSITMTTAILSVTTHSTATGAADDARNAALRQNKAFQVTYAILLRRMLTNLWRQPVLLVNRITQCLFYALILSCYYAPLGHNQTAIQNRIGLLYEITPLAFIGMLNCIAMFPTERDIFLREYVDGYYHAFAYLAAYLTVTIPLMAVAAFCIAALVTCATNLVVSGSAVAKFTYVIFLFVFTGESLGVVFCMLFEEIGFAVNIMSAIFSIFCILAGYISLSMPQFLVDLSYISPITWGSYILANTAFAGQTFSCGDTPAATCVLTTGEDVLSLYGFTGGGSMGFHYLMVSVLVFVYFLVMLVAFRWRAYRISH